MITSEGAIKSRVQGWIVTISVVLLIGKFIAFALTNSVGVLTDAMESIVNVVAGFISLYSIRMAAKPKDESHPFGHGKVELISASIEGLLIIVAGAMIFYEGTKRFFVPSEIGQLDTGILIIALAGCVNAIMGWYSIRVGRKYQSIALISGGKHLLSDTYSTIGLVAGLILLYITKLNWIDSALALIFGSLIIYTGISILRKTVANLMDKADNKTLQEIVNSVAQNRKRDWIDVHNMKCIRYGSSIFVDCDLTLPWYYNVRESHDACDSLKATIVDEFSGRVVVSIHSDPCKPPVQCSICLISTCPHREAPFAEVLDITLREITQSDDQRNE